MATPHNQEEPSHFDLAAATWDENPRRQAMTQAIAKGICRSIPLDREWRMLEYGCGTASLSFLLAPSVGEIVAADASPGMIAQVRLKLAAYPSLKISPLLLDLSCDASPAGSFDLIVTAMALHHVENVPAMLSRLSSLLKTQGWLVIADLCPDDGSFHDPMKVPHDGFDPQDLSRIITGDIGMAECRWNIVHTVEKNGRSYNIFLLTAR